MVDDSGSGSNTPAGDDDDFFSSWDKPTIKRPSNPPSRTATPAGIGRTASPFLSAPTGGPVRPKSPLAGTDASASATPRAVPSAAIRKAPATGTVPRKANILGAKKTTKLGAKKITAGDDLDFEEAERKAKEEAERIAKLGYDPDAEDTAAAPPQVTRKASTTASNILSPTPVSPGGFGQTKGGERGSGEVERLGMGMGRLGFGQVGASKAAAGQAPKRMGFGAVGSSRSAQQGGYFPQSFHLILIHCAEEADRTARDKFGTQKGISSDEFFGRAQFDASAQTEAKSRLQGFEGATSISSNAYFGRPEDENNDEDYGDLETAAKDIVRKLGITAGDDLDNVTQLIGEGASRLQGKLFCHCFCKV